MSNSGHAQAADPSERLAAIWERSEFRRGVHLNDLERKELQAIGLQTTVERSRPLVAARLGPAEPPNDGRQTPWHGFPTFPAQHATATCCRACLQKHHGIPTGAPLGESQLDYILACLRVFWERELATQEACQCRRCARGQARAIAKPRVLHLDLDGETEGREGDRSKTEPKRCRTRGGAQQESRPPGFATAGGREGETAAGPPVTTGYNDLDLRRWKEYSEIETGSLWLFGARDRAAGHSLDYHGNFVPQIATQTFQRFSRRGEIILDLFLGSGTSAIEACRLERRCLGVELKSELVQAVHAKLAAQIGAGRVAVVEGDSRAAATADRVRAQLREWGSELAHLLVLHPPYHDIISFSDRPEDLSNAPSTDAFVRMFRETAARGGELLEPGRFAVLVIGDKYSQGELVPLGFLCMQAMNEEGFRTRSIVVKNIEGNEIGKGRANNLWRYRALRGGFYIFKHEYVMIFQKR